MSRKQKPSIFEKELHNHHFRVAIFGSARIKNDHQIYKDVFDLAKVIGKHGFDIVTGGGPGIMEAANSGHNEGDEENKAHSIGVRIKLPYEEQRNRHLEVEKEFRTFSKRLDNFMALSHAVVVMPGGIGTCLELFFTWQLTQVHHIGAIPIILVGDMWKDLIKWAKKWILKRNFMKEDDFNSIYLVKNNKEAMDIIMKTYEKYEHGETRQTKKQLDI